VLELDCVSRGFGGAIAIDEVSLVVEEGEIRCLVGPNGAGKTTLFNLIAGSLKPSSGTIRLRGVDVTGFSPRKMSMHGVARKYQAPSVFDEFSVADNLRIAIDGKRRLRSLVRPDSSVRERVCELVEELGLTEVVDVDAGHLSHGQRQWLEIGMVLANDPRLLLLDEPTAGMTREETAMTEELVRSVSRSRSLTTIVIEHDIGFVRALGDRITVLHEGVILREGSAEDIEHDPEVRRVYLGGVE
jgi:urea transport system ATP-binding protein